MFFKSILFITEPGTYSNTEGSIKCSKCYYNSYLNHIIAHHFIVNRKKYQNIGIKKKRLAKAKLVINRTNQ